MDPWEFVTGAVVVIESTLEELDENVEEESELDWYGVFSDPKLMTNPSGRELL